VTLNCIELPFRHNVPIMKHQQPATRDFSTFDIMGNDNGRGIIILLNFYNQFVDGFTGKGIQTSNLYLSSKNMEATTKNLMDLTAKLNNDSSALHLFIDENDFADSLQLLLYRLDVGIEEATKAAESIQRSGLIRMFSKDPDKKKKGNNPDQ